LYFLDGENLFKRVTFKNSMHQLDLQEALAYAEVLGNSPSAVVIGIEPADISPWGLDLTEPVQSGIEAMTRLVLQEIEKAGGTYVSKDPPAAVLR